MSICSRADLLLALQQSSEEDWPQLAAGLDFASTPKTRVLEAGAQAVATSVFSATIAVTAIGIRKDSSTPARPPLKQYLYGISEWHSHYASLPPPPGVLDTEQEPLPSLQPLELEDYAAPNPSAPPWQALASRAQLTRHSLPALAARWPGLQVDVPRIVAQLARLQLPSRLPRREQRLPPARVWLVLQRNLHNRCLWQDQTHCLHLLRQKLGPGALSVACVDADPFYPLSFSHAGAPFSAFHAWPTVLPEVLLLHCEPEAKQTSGQTEGQTRWQELATHFAARGVRVLWFAGASLSPFPPPALPVDEAIERGLQKLLTLAACARRIEPGLLRALRLADPSLSHLPELENLAWNHPDLQAGYDVALWKPACVAHWRTAFSGLDASLQAKVWDILTEQHAHCGRWIGVQECLCLAAHAKPELQQAREAEIKAAEEWLQRLLTSPEARPDHAGFVLLARQTAGAFEKDLVLRQRFSLINKLWEIAEQAQHGQQTRARYWLRQYQGRLLLCADREQAHLPGVLPGSPMGMPLLLNYLWLEVDEERKNIQLPAHGQCVLANMSPGRRLVLGNADFHCVIAQIEADFAQECGRDEYGMFALWRVKGQEWRLRYIEAGAFWMGSPEGEHKRHNDEAMHHVNISNGFWLAETACPQAWWLALTGKNPSRFHEKNGGGPPYPVEQVSWLEVQAFLQEVNRVEMDNSGWQASLPTEAEWEYACRAGTSTPFCWGNDISSTQANFDGNYPYRGEKKEEYREKTMPVQSFVANPWGLWQMHGNVWEWCADLYVKDVGGMQFDPGLSQAYTPDLDDYGGRVLRGGSWIVSARFAHAAYRSRDWTGGRSSDVSWRVVLRLRRP